MGASMAQRFPAAWQMHAARVCALLLVVLFGASGAWKLTSPLDWSARLIQMQIPGVLAMPGTLAVGIAEMAAAAMLLVPRYRRWGACLTGLLLVVFMMYIGWNYQTLRGEECSCFPWLKRSIGPQFFAGDLLLVAMAAAAGRWSQRSGGPRGALLITAAIAVFAGVSYGVAVSRLSGIEAPASVTAGGKPFSLREGRIFLFFFDPECRHCFDAARRLSSYHWRDVKVLAVTTRVPQFAGQFLLDTGLKAAVTSDADLLREKFKFTDPPYGVLLEHGRQKEAFLEFDVNQPHTRLAAMGHID